MLRSQFESTVQHSITLVGCLFILFGAVGEGIAQPETQSADDGQVEYSKHLLYVEGLGMSVIYALNYEYKLNRQMGIRAGVGIVPDIELNLFSHSDDPSPCSRADGTSCEDAALDSFPVSFHYSPLISANGNHHLELGIGTTLLLANNFGEIRQGDNTPFFFDEGRSVGWFFAGHVGYRYEPTTGGFLFRFGLVPGVAITDGGTHFTSLPSISFGYAVPPGPSSGETQDPSP